MDIVHHYGFLPNTKLEKLDLFPSSSKKWRMKDPYTVGRLRKDDLDHWIACSKGPSCAGTYLPHFYLMTETDAFSKTL